MSLMEVSTWALPFVVPMSTLLMEWFMEGLGGENRMDIGKYMIISYSTLIYISRIKDWVRVVWDGYRTAPGNNSGKKRITNITRVDDGYLSDSLS